MLSSLQTASDVFKLRDRISKQIIIKDACQPIQLIECPVDITTARITHLRSVVRQIKLVGNFTIGCCWEDARSINVLKLTGDVESRIVLACDLREIVLSSTQPTKAIISVIFLRHAWDLGATRIQITS